MVRLTPAGRALAENVHAALGEFLERSVTRLPEHDRRELRRLLHAWDEIASTAGELDVEDSENDSENENENENDEVADPREVLDPPDEHLAGPVMKVTARPFITPTVEGTPQPMPAWFVPQSDVVQKGSHL